MKNVKIEEGIEPAVFRDIIGDMVRQRAGIQNVYEVVGAIEFEYTYWAKPDNKSAVRQNLIDVSLTLWTLSFISDFEIILNLRNNYSCGLIRCMDLVLITSSNFKHSAAQMMAGISAVLLFTCISSLTGLSMKFSLPGWVIWILKYFFA